jgi:hypothetical protein
MLPDNFTVLKRSQNLKVDVVIGYSPTLFGTNKTGL